MLIDGALSKKSKSRGARFGVSDQEALDLLSESNPNKCGVKIHCGGGGDCFGMHRERCDLLVKVIVTFQV